MQVGMPTGMRVQLLVLAAVDYGLSYGWETFLRQRFPAACPPQKGYQAFSAELESIEAQQLGQGEGTDMSRKKER